METSMIKFFLFYMAEILKSELVYDTQTNSYFKVENRYDDGEILASPISGGTESVMLKLKNCITAESLDFGENNPFLTPNQPRINAATTPNQPRNNSAASPKQPRIKSADEVDSDPEFIGKLGHLYKKMSSGVPDYLYDICEKIEDLIHKKIIHAERAETLKTAKKDYTKYVKILESDSESVLNELESLKIKINKNLKQSKSGKIGEEQASERKRTYTKLKQTAGTIFLLFVIGGVIYFGAGGTVDTSALLGATKEVVSEENSTDTELAQHDKRVAEIEQTNGLAEKNIPRKKYSDTEIDAKIAEYVEKTKVKIWDWRKTKIKEQAKGKSLSNWEIENLIQKNLKK